MILDTITSVWRSATDRLSSPFFGSFVVSWLVWNWRFVFVLFHAPTDQAQAITLLESYLGVWNSVVYPACTAVIYTVGLSFVDLHLSRWQRRFAVTRLQEDFRSREELLRLKSTLLQLQATCSLTAEKQRLELENKEKDSEHNRRMRELNQEAQIAAQRDRDNRDHERDEHDRSLRKLQLEKERLELDNLRKNNSSR